MTRAREFRLLNHVGSEHRSLWWNGQQSRATVPTYLQEEPADERAAHD